jgi:hypothetical protein
MQFDQERSLMLFPAFSVTLIGLVIGGVAAANNARPLRPILIAVSGAWAGLLAGALVGVAIDAIAGTGIRARSCSLFPGWCALPSAGGGYQPVGTAGGLQHRTHRC